MVIVFIIVLYKFGEGLLMGMIIIICLLLGVILYLKFMGEVVVVLDCVCL